MLNPSALYKLFKILVAGVWLVNGLYCKVLNGVPRHRLIVAEILGQEYASAFTIAIGVAEILMAVWILSGIKAKLNACIQIAVVLLMNIMEFFIAPHLLLFGRLNLIFAILFALFIYYNEFVLNVKASRQQ